MWIIDKITDPNTGVEYNFWAKVYEVGSHYGIGGNGKISKLSIKRVGSNELLMNYDRSWDKKPTKEIKTVYAEILKKYNY
jgi:hypothetical protein